MRRLLCVSCVLFRVFCVALLAVSRPAMETVLFDPANAILFYSILFYSILFYSILFTLPIFLLWLTDHFHLIREKRMRAINRILLRAMWCM